MARVAQLVCGLLFVLWLLPVFPQSPADAPRRPDRVAHLTVGQSVFPLFGPWKFTVGDSPVDAATGKRLWAQPAFDDSSWEDVDLTPPAGSFNPIAGFNGYVPGWTLKGHPGYSGFAWYRIRVKVQALPGEKLALAGPSDLDDGYELYDGGSPIGSFGEFSGTHPKVFYTQPMYFSLPSDVRKGADGSVVLALRVWMDPYDLVTQPEAGGLHSAPLLGDAGSVAAGYQSAWIVLIKAYAVVPVLALLFALLAVIAVCLRLLDRSDSVYLWLAGVFLLMSASNTFSVISSWTRWISSIPGPILTDAVFLPLALAVWVMVWWTWFRLRRPAWVPWATLALTIVHMISIGLGEEIVYGLIPHSIAVYFHWISLLARLAIAAILVLIVVLGVRAQGREGWLVMPPILLYGLNQFSQELLILNVRLSWFPYGVRVQLGQLALALLVGALFVLMLRRLRMSLKAQREQALDVKQAQEVQHVILPETQAVFGSFTVESEYRPAREVGGDFFQVIEHPADGSLLIVTGDVAGKGLQAGMLVALLVGAIRATAAYDFEPLAMLNSLNHRLLGRGSAAATCLVLRVCEDGTATLANAGHVPPYLNGEPVAMEGALPLGISEYAEFSVMQFRLESGDKLVMVSDGVLEARDGSGALLGFERLRAMLMEPMSVTGLADAAQRFGQEDDISVLAVTRMA